MRGQKPTDCNAQLPMPWNPTYKKYWTKFVNQLAAKYGRHPVLVSVAVAGPTAASAEMILPHDSHAGPPDTTSDCQWMQRLLNQHGPPAPATCTMSGMPPKAVWPATATWPPSGTSPDQPFVTEWNNAIDMYAVSFQRADAGGHHGQRPSRSTGSTPVFLFQEFSTLLSEECAGIVTMDCAAETAILYDFVQLGAGGINNNATHTSGVEGCKDDKDLGIVGVRNLAKATMTNPGFSTLILGGGQFNEKFTAFPGQDKCSLISGATIYSPEQSVSDAMQYFFNDTAGGLAFGGTKGVAPLNYLQVYWQDITYASDHANDTPPSGTQSVKTSLDTARDQLNLTSEAEPTCTPGTTCLY